jgi:hypothetical protein
MIARNTLNILPTLLRIGQSLWLENITCEQLQNGFLVQHIKERSIMGASVSTDACAHTLRNTVSYDNLAFAASEFANRLKPLLAVGLRRMAILVVLLQNLALFGHVDDPLRGPYLQ